MGASARIFNEHLLEDQQGEKRHARRLQELAAQADFAHPPSLRKRLTEALGVIMEAMDAQTAALLLLDASSNQLVMSATAGDAHEELEKHVGSLDAGTLAGMIATHPGEPTSVSDAETTPLEVSAALRLSGIHSLLGVGLSSHHHLRGVMYVGVRERRIFTASEVRRLQGLADAMAVQLENSRLSAALREKTESAAAETELQARFISALVHDMVGAIVAAKRAARGLLDRAVTGAEAPAVTILDSLGRLEEMVAKLVDAQRIRTEAMGD